MQHIYNGGAGAILLVLVALAASGIAQEASSSTGASDSLSNRNLAPITFETDKFAETLAYLKENGAVISITVEYGNGRASIDAHVPSTLLVPLYGMDHIWGLREVVEAMTNNTSPQPKIDEMRFDLVVGEARNVTSIAVDPDGDTLSYEILEPPGGLGSVSVSISNDTMTLTSIAQGQDYIRMVVLDGRGGHDLASFRVCVVESNSPPQLSPMPSRIVVPVGAETIAIQVHATDADGDEIFLPSIVDFNSTVADIRYPFLGPYLIPQVYLQPEPCVPRLGEERSDPLFITPNAAGKSTVTIRAGDIWGGKDTETFQVIVYEPLDPDHGSFWPYEIPRSLFPTHQWAPWR